jgi:L-fuculose-phosphate aldolase
MLPRVSFDTERRALADACHRLAAAGMVIDTAGNLSVRAGDRVVVTPTGCVLSEVQPDAMTVVDLDGNVQDGGRAPTSELGLHLGVYRAMDWTGAVVHTHSPMATAVGCVLDELPAIHYQMLALGGSVRVAPYATFGTDELHANVLAALEGHTAALMQNHGAITCGAGIRQAVEATFLLEWAANMYWHASRLGTPSTLTEEQLAAVGVQAAKFNYGGAGG